MDSELQKMALAYRKAAQEVLTAAVAYRDAVDAVQSAEEVLTDLQEARSAPTRVSGQSDVVADLWDVVDSAQKTLLEAAYRLP